MLFDILNLSKIRQQINPVAAANVLPVPLCRLYCACTLVDEFFRPGTFERQPAYKHQR